MKIHALIVLSSAICAAFCLSPAVRGQAVAVHPAASLELKLGTTDFRISDMGPDGNTYYDGGDASVAYNPIENEYLVVWHGKDTTPGLTNIFGQRIDAASGLEIGPNDFQISEPPPCCSTSYEARWPAVVYNPTAHEYLVVWREGSATVQIMQGDFNIYGQRLDAATGLEVGVSSFAISDMGPGWQYQADAPAVTYNGMTDEYLVAWPASSDTLMDPGEKEIFGQRLDGATAAEVGADDFRISDMGPDGDPSFNAGLLQFHGDSVTVAYNATDNEYLVVWFGNDVSVNQWNIYGQRLDATTGNEIGSNDFPINDDTPGSLFVLSMFPSLTYNATDNEYLVVWQKSGQPFFNSTVLGQRLTGPTAAKLGVSEFLVSDLGSAGGLAAAFHDLTTNEYMVVWNGDVGGGEFEVLGQRIDGTSGTSLSPCAFRISNMGTDGSTNFGPITNALAFNTTTGESLVVWAGDDDMAPLVDDEIEIFGQLLLGGTNPWCDLGNGLAGTHGVPSLQGTGTLLGGDSVSIDLTGALENSPAWLALGFAELNAPFKGGVLVPDISLPGLVLALSTGPLGGISISTLWTAGLPSGFTTYFQYWVQDPVGPLAFAASNGLSGTTP